MNSSIEVKADPAVQYLLLIGDACLIHGQRIAEWCGHEVEARHGHASASCR